MPVDGWTLPGVMTVGGAQTLLKQAAVGAEHAVLVALAHFFVDCGTIYPSRIASAGGPRPPSAQKHGALRYTCRHGAYATDDAGQGLSWLATIRRYTQYVAGVKALTLVAMTRPQRYLTTPPQDHAIP